MEPDQILKEAADVFKEKEKEYGSAYLRHGKIMSEFFPDGIYLNTAEDFLEYNNFEMLVAKLNRIASCMIRKEFHEDSYTDIMVYSSMAISINKKKQKRRS